jgi:uncharacterized Zn-finger protein
MADHSTPHFHNSAGHRLIHVGAREFMCIGALPPFDHPHIFLDMGDETDIVCGYCSTLYRFDPALTAAQTRPDGCTYPPKAA